MSDLRFDVSPTGLLVIRDGTWEWRWQGTRADGPTPPTPTQPAGRVWDSRLDARGVKLIAAGAAGGLSYWRLVRAQYRSRDEAQGKHHIYVETLDETGRRLAGVKLIAAWDGGQADFFSEEKAGEEAAANYPMFAAGWGYRVRVEGLSDEVAGMGLGDIGSEHMAEHVGYFLVFQRTRA